MPFSAFAQTNPHFNVRLNINYESADKCIGLYEGLSGSGREIVPLRGSQIALATTADLARRRLSSERLEASLDGIKFGQTEADDVFRLKEAKENVASIKELLTTIKRRNFSQRVAATVEQLFPANAKVSTTIPMFVVAFGHNNIDAYVRRVVWEGDVPRFVGEGEGELTIVINLAKGVKYGRNADERFIGVLSVVAHEVFHAAFGVYKDASPVWQEYYSARRTYLDRLLDLTHNEGIAHYLTFEQRSGGYLPQDWDQKIAASFAEFNRSAEELLSSRISPQRAHYLISTSNTSEYWQSYGAITGMFIARTIDQKLGRAALTATVANGADAFYLNYIQLAERDDNLPRLSASISRQLQQKR
ncbi:MAG: hypothetical protein KF749_07085 [Bacteroidetes bacterium]|nr:hypothetical protein [Bacteroidota bacterium]MCW5896535.1 hypothetical protein [Bacteroidota bacterium]